MDIKHLEKQESFWSIFQPLFSNFLINMLKEDVEFSYDHTLRHHFFLSRIYNIIYHEDLLTSSSLNSFHAEYRNHPVFTKNLILGLVYHLNKISIFRYFFSVKIFSIKCNSDISSIVVIPGNHTVRILDIEKQTCTVVRKKNYPLIFLHREIKARTEFAKEISPRFIQKLEDDEGYIEEMIELVPLNRIQLRSQYILSEKKGLGFMRDIYEISYVRRNFKSYVSSIMDFIQVNWKKFSSLKEECLCFISDKVERHLTTNSSLDIYLAFSHGDFQESNIVWDVKNSKTLIIDWEYSEYRSISYDIATYCLVARNANEIDSFWFSFKKAILENRYNIFSEDVVGTIQENVYIYFFLWFLEDLKLKFEVGRVQEIETSIERLSYVLNQLNTWMINE